MYFLFFFVRCVDDRSKQERKKKRSNKDERENSCMYTEKNSSDRILLLEMRTILANAK